MDVCVTLQRHGLDCENNSVKGGGGRLFHQQETMTLNNVTVSRNRANAATDGVRVLSLSEAALRQMIKSDPAMVARLLLNISKVLCRRILRER